MPGRVCLQRRAQVLEVLQGAVDEGRAGAKAAGELPPLTAEGVVGAAFGVIHARLLEPHPEPLTELLNPLMAMIVLPYRGQAAAARELARPAPEPTVALAGRERLGASLTAAGVGRARIPFRLTVRTHRVLCAVAELSGQGSDPNNREVADAAGVSDQGQISKLLARLEGHGLLQNTGGNTQGIARAWRLTPRGEEIVRVGRPRRERTGNGADPAFHIPHEGDKVNPTEHTAKTPSPKTGLFATLRAFLCAEGSGAPSHSSWKRVCTFAALTAFAVIAVATPAAYARTAHNYESVITEVPEKGPGGESVPLPGGLEQVNSMTVHSGDLYVAEHLEGEGIRGQDGSVGAFAVETGRI